MTRVAWIVYGGLEARTGGTIYDAIIVAGLRAHAEVEVVAIEPGAPADALLARLLGASVVIGDELCFRELAEVFPRLAGARRVLLVHHLTCWEEELPPSERAALRAVELAALRAADDIVTTSHTTRARLQWDPLESTCRHASLSIL